MAFRLAHKSSPSKALAGSRSAISVGSKTTKQRDGNPGLTTRSAAQKQQKKQHVHYKASHSEGDSEGDGEELSEYQTEDKDELADETESVTSSMNNFIDDGEDQEDEVSIHSSEDMDDGAKDVLGAFSHREQAVDDSGDSIMDEPINKQLPFISKSNSKAKHVTKVKGKGKSRKVSPVASEAEDIDDGSSIEIITPKRVSPRIRAKADKQTTTPPSKGQRPKTPVTPKKTWKTQKHGVPSDSEESPSKRVKESLDRGSRARPLPRRSVTSSPSKVLVPDTPPSVYSSPTRAARKQPRSTMSSPAKIVVPETPPKGRRHSSYKPKPKAAGNGKPDIKDEERSPQKLSIKKPIVPLNIGATDKQTAKRTGKPDQSSVKGERRILGMIPRDRDIVDWDSMKKDQRFDGKYCYGMLYQDLDNLRPGNMLSWQQNMKQIPLPTPTDLEGECPSVDNRILADALQFHQCGDYGNPSTISIERLSLNEQSEGKFTLEINMDRSGRHPAWALMNCVSVISLRSVYLDKAKPGKGLQVHGVQGALLKFFYPRMISTLCTLTGEDTLQGQLQDMAIEFSTKAEGKGSTSRRSGEDGVGHEEHILDNDEARFFSNNSGSGSADPKFAPINDGRLGYDEKIPVFNLQGTDFNCNVPECWEGLERGEYDTLATKHVKNQDVAIVVYTVSVVKNKEKEYPSVNFNIQSIAMIGINHN